MKNSERIKSMTDEELAKFMAAYHCNTYGKCAIEYGEFCSSMNGKYCDGMEELYSEKFNRYYKWLRTEVSKTKENDTINNEINQIKDCASCFTDNCPFHRCINCDFLSNGLGKKWLTELAELKSKSIKNP